MSYGSPSPPFRARALATWSVQRDTVVRLMKYSAVSLVSTTTSLVSLGMLVGLAGLPATWSNVIATAVGTVPSFELNRRWVWSNDGRRSVFGQVVPFCALSFSGLVVSTLAVDVVAAHTANWGRWSHTVAVLMANLASYGSLWIVQYQLLNRILFSIRSVSLELPGAEVSVGRQSGLRSHGHPCRKVRFSQPTVAYSPRRRNDSTS
jgi:putative flippase GtrA